MKNYRIAIVEYDHPLAGKKKSYALQKRIGFFFWYTHTKCDSVDQCLTVYDNVKDKKEKIINVLRRI